MKLTPCKGDVLEVAPAGAEAVVLWLRCGFNLRSVTWDRLARNQLTRVPSQGQVERRDHPHRRTRPWRAATDTLWKIEPPLGMTRFVYVFANPADAVGFDDLEEVGKAVRRALGRLCQVEVRRLAMIHIPCKRMASLDFRETNITSARTMVDALTSWDREHAGVIDELYLVDMRDDFRMVVGE